MPTFSDSLDSQTKEDKWQRMAETPTKGERMPMTEAHFDKVIAMRDEVIDDLRKEVVSLKRTVNQLRQKG